MLDSNFSVCHIIWNMDYGKKKMNSYHKKFAPLFVHVWDRIIANEFVNWKEIEFACKIRLKVDGNKSEKGIGVKMKLL